MLIIFVNQHNQRKFSFRHTGLKIVLQSRVPVTKPTLTKIQQNDWVSLNYINVIKPLSPVCNTNPQQYSETISIKLDIDVQMTSAARSLHQVSSPQVLVWGRSSSLSWPTQYIPDTAQPPVRSLPPCPGRGPAESGPGGQPWPCWWRSGTAAQTSAGRRALENT